MLPTAATCLGAQRTGSPTVGLDERGCDLTLVDLVEPESCQGSNRILVREVESSAVIECELSRGCPSLAQSSYITVASEEGVELEGRHHDIRVFGAGTRTVVLVQYFVDGESGSVSRTMLTWLDDDLQVVGTVDLEGFAFNYWARSESDVIVLDLAVAPTFTVDESGRGVSNRAFVAVAPDGAKWFRPVAGNVLSSSSDGEFGYYVHAERTADATGLGNDIVELVKFDIESGLSIACTALDDEFELETSFQLAHFGGLGWLRTSYSGLWALNPSTLSQTSVEPDVNSGLDRIHPVVTDDSTALWLGDSPFVVRCERGAEPRVEIPPEDSVAAGSLIPLVGYNETVRLARLGAPRGYTTVGELTQSGSANRVVRGTDRLGPSDRTFLLEDGTWIATSESGFVRAEDGEGNILWRARVGDGPNGMTFAAPVGRGRLLLYWRPDAGYGIHLALLDTVHGTLANTRSATFGYDRWWSRLPPHAPIVSGAERPRTYRR